MSSLSPQTGTCMKWTSPDGFQIIWTSFLGESGIEEYARGSVQFAWIYEEKLFSKCY